MLTWFVCVCVCVVPVSILYIKIFSKNKFIQIVSVVHVARACGIAWPVYARVSEFPPKDISRERVCL